MWDVHWCKSAARRVEEMAGPLNETLKAARERGIFVIHAPSTTTDFYDGTPQRKRAQEAPYAPTPVPLVTSPRWGTAWYWTDAKREGVLPIDDSDMGCDCKVKCEIGAPWKRQIAAIEIAEADAITDNGQETWNLLASRGIDNVILCGVHLNMCVLGRPFAIRQMTVLEKKVALMRDMTDTMYNPERPPGVSHFAGTELMVEHVERFWCPTFTSSDITGKASFRFSQVSTERDMERNRSSCTGFQRRCDLIQIDQFSSVASGSHVLTNQVNRFETWIDHPQTRRMREEVEHSVVLDGPVNTPAYGFQEPLQIPSTRAKGADIANRAHGDLE
jgi:nicotinamidase-related amidase